MGTFLLISVALHVAVLLFGPQGANRAGAQLPSLLSGGVVQVVRMDEPVASQRTTPQTVQPERRPTPAQRQADPKPPAAPEPRPAPEEPAPPEPTPEPAIQAPVQAEPVEPPLTSPRGEQRVPDPPAPQPAPEPEPAPKPEPAAQEPPAARVAPREAGGSNSTAPAADPVPEEPGPPALPPLGEPGSLINLGSTSLGYPKNAENQGLEGDVEVRLEMDASGKVTRVLLIRPSGHAVLDEYAMRGLSARVQNLTGSAQAAPYAVQVRVSFRREGGAFVGQMQLVGSAEYLQER